MRCVARSRFDLRNRPSFRRTARAAKANIDISITAGQHQAIAGTWQAQDRAAASSSQDAQLMLEAASHPSSDGTRATVYPFPDVARQVEDAIGRCAAWKAADGDWATRGSIFCAATVAREVAKVAALAGEVVAPGICADIRSSSGLFPFVLRRQALADKRTVGTRIGLAHADDRQSRIFAGMKWRSTGPRSDADRVSGDRDLGPIDLKSRQGDAPRGTLVFLALVVAVRELTRGNKHIVGRGMAGSDG